MKGVLAPRTPSAAVLLTVKTLVLVAMEALTKRACSLVSSVVTWLWWPPLRGAEPWAWRRPVPQC